MRTEIEKKKDNRALYLAGKRKHYQKTGEKQRNYRRKYSVGNLYRRT
jgi:hypothetical protein